MNVPGPHSYVPTPAEVTAVVAESSDTRTFVIEPRKENSQLASARPGQFVMLSLPGHGEAAFTLASAAGVRVGESRIALTIRRVGRLTTALFALQPGALVGLRGPFGRGFPDWPPDASLLFAAGGCGLVPLTAAIEERISDSGRRGAVTILFGARDPASRIHRDSLERWRNASNVALLEAVEQGASGWTGRVGHVGDLLDEALKAERPDFAAVCGPPTMMSLVARRLHGKAALDPSSISLAVERQMKCALGTCGRCYVGSGYACRDGPVFTLADLADLDPAYALDGARAARAAATGLSC